MLDVKLIKNASTFSPIPFIMKMTRREHEIETDFGKYGYDLWRSADTLRIHHVITSPIHEATVSPWGRLLELLRERVSDD